MRFCLRLTAAAALLTASVVGTATAAALHQPLPAGSLEPNGAPQALVQHHPKHLPPAALPGGGVRPDAAAGLARAYSGAPIDVLTYHYDGLRTGWNASETDLTPASVAGASFGKLATIAVDGNVLAQPLLVSGFRMPDGTIHDVLIVVTGHDTVYAFDARTYAVLWQVSLGVPQSSNDVGCGDVVPEYGISSTPVIVRASQSAATLYVVSATEPAAYAFHTQVHALSLANGADVATPVEIDPGALLGHPAKKAISLDPQNQWNRAGLAWANNSLYIGIGSHCDNDAQHITGWLLRYDSGLSLVGAFHTIDSGGGYQLSSIWMTGFAPAVDTAGNLFVVTGNGHFQTGTAFKDYGESVLSLSADLSKVNSSFTPFKEGALNAADTDFGSGGVMLLPSAAGQAAPPLAVAMGKDATMYLLDQTSLGGRSQHDAGALQATRLGGSGGGVWGGPAYFGGSGGVVYYQIDSDVLRAFRVYAGAAAPPSLTQFELGTSPAGYGGSIPVVSSKGGTNGVVWLVRRGATEQLEAYDALALGAPLFAANAGVWSNTANGNSFVTPLVANGRVYVGAYKTVTVFGLTK